MQIVRGPAAVRRPPRADDSPGEAARSKLVAGECLIWSVLHVARPPHLGFQVCDRCKKILCRPPSTPWPAGALVSVVSPIDSDPATPCKPYAIEEANYIRSRKPPTK